MRRHIRRAMLGLTTATVLAGSVLSGCASETADEQRPADSGSPGAAAPSAEAVAAASWLTGQLRDGLMRTSFENPPGSGRWTTSEDYGLSLDVYFALLGMDEFAAQRSDVLDAVEPRVAAYVGSGKDAYAGSIGKLLTAVQAADTDPAEYAGGDLLSKLERLVVTKGPEQGRAADTWDPASEFGGDFSNTIGQSWVVHALTEADSDWSDETVTFLLKQQCGDGFFRLSMESEDHSCDAGTDEESAPSVDATAFAVLALRTVQDGEVRGVEPAVESALSAAGEWLVSAQADDGSFVDSGVANANSTGVAGEALLALGEDPAAAAAAEWLADHQVTDESVGELAGQSGAVAFDGASLQAGKKRGIDRAVRNQWQRATAQAVGALEALATATTENDGSG